MTREEVLRSELSQLEAKKPTGATSYRAMDKRTARIAKIRQMLAKIETKKGGQ